MKQIITNNEKIEQIRNERRELLNKVRENIKNKNNLAATNIWEIMEAMYKEEKSTKEYIAIIKAKEMISELTIKIVEAKNVEEIISLRKKVNYYINKIKKILKDRGITPTELNKLSNNVNYMRKDISKYIRILKRENSLNEIVAMNESLDTLSIDEVKKLKQLIEIEKKYNKRNISSLENETMDIKNIKEETKPKFPITYQQLIKRADNILYGDTPQITLNPPIQETKKTRVSLNPTNKPQQNMEDYIQKFDGLNNEYGICKLQIYNSSLFKNCIRLVDNIPRYLSNKKKIKLMKCIYNNYYQEPNFGLFIKYTKDNNSVTNAIRTIFKRSKLFRRETECLTEHSEYREWIHSYLATKNKTLQKAS